MGFVYGSTFRLDDKGEIVITPSGDLSIVTEYEKIKQDLIVCLRSQKNQYIFNLDYGVDYQKFLKDNLLAFLVEKEIRKALENYPYIDSVTKASAERVGHNINISAEVKLKDGSILKINTETT